MESLGTSTNLLNMVSERGRELVAHLREEAESAEAAALFRLREVNSELQAAERLEEAEQHALQTSVRHPPTPTSP
eukprot:9408990-Lingulodinium_polyedra.AAC.1